VPEITFTTKPRPPFRLDLTVFALRRWHPYAGLVYLLLLVDGVRSGGSD
jgi:hypothetical protein